MSQNHLHFDDLEAWASVSSREGYGFRDQACKSESSAGAFRLADGLQRRKVLARHLSALDNASWMHALGELSGGQSVATGHAQAYQALPEPVTFHPPFADRLQRTGELKEVAESMLANIWHEAERTGGLKSVRGAWYDTRLTAIARRGGSLSCITGSFQTEVIFNQLFKDRFCQVLAPVALGDCIRACVWRELPKQIAGGHHRHRPSCFPPP